MWICPAQRGCIAQSIRVDARGESFFFYTGRMPASGVLVAGSMHARVPAFVRSSLLFSATPQQLGFVRDQLQIAFLQQMF